MAPRYLDDGNDDGTVFGQSPSSKISFYGGTTIVQPSAITPVTTTAATTSTPYGYSTSTQADAIVTAINQIISTLSALNLTA